MKRRSLLGMFAASPLDRAAESYARLVLALGVHQPDYVDAYYGPAAWREEAESRKEPLETIRDRARALAEDLAGTPAPAGEVLRLRHQYLVTQTRSLVARTEMALGRRMSFDEESQALYDAVEPTYPESYFAEAIRRMQEAIPGDGALGARYQAFTLRFSIPREKLDAVYRAAIEESRRRTLRYLKLPAGESFGVEYVGDRPWSAYNWFKGQGRSVIQVNTDFPIDVDRLINLAAHEGYPGHHVYNALLEQRLLRERGWKEFCVYALFSPQSLIAEGAAEFGFELAFPLEERREFSQRVLLPIAGLDSGDAGRYFAVRAVAGRLGEAGNAAARRYLDGQMSREAAIEWLQQYALNSPERAQQRLRFFDVNRSYVINYTHGQKIVRAWVEKRGRDRAGQWRAFGQLLSTPRVPSGLI